MKKHNRLSTTLMLGATVGSALVGTVVPLTQAHASTTDPDAWTTEGFTQFPYANIDTVDGVKMTQENTPIIAWVNASRITGGQIDSLLSGGAQGTHYPLFSDGMTANGKVLYCINPFRMSPTEENKAKGYDTTSKPDNCFGAALYQAALLSYPNTKDPDGDGKNGTILDRIVSTYTVWLAHGIAQTSYGKDLNASFKWDDIKDNFSNDKNVLGAKNGWVLNAYKTLSNSDQAKVKKAIEKNYNALLTDTRLPQKPTLELSQSQDYDTKTGVTKVTYTPKLTAGFKYLHNPEMNIQGLSSKDVKVEQDGKALSPDKRGVYSLDNTKPFTVTVQPQAKKTDAKIRVEGTVKCAHVQTFDAKSNDIQNSISTEPDEVDASATLTTTVHQSLGSMKLHKVDDENKPLKGIEFTLYKDADLKHKVKSGTTDADGNLTFDNLEFGDYYLAETKGDADHSIKFKTKKISINSTVPNVEFTEKGSIVNDKKNIDIATILKAENNNQVDATWNTMEDEAEVTHLRKNATYRVVDGLYDQETKKLIQGSEVTGTLKTDKDGKVTTEGSNIEFLKGNSSQAQFKMKNMKANLSGLAGKKVTANVKIERIENGKVVEKANEQAETQLTDPNQTATVLKPQIETDAYGNYNAKLINPYEKTKITDKTKASNLVKGHTYKAKMRLMMIGKDGKATPVVGKDKKPVMVDKVFTANDTTQALDIEFPEFDSTAYAGQKLGVVYTLTDNDRDKDGKEVDLADHNQDLKDAKEIVEVTKPTVETKALVDGDKEANVSSRSHISDIVTVKGLATGQPVSVNAIAGDDKGNLLEIQSKGKKYNLMNRVNVDLTKKDANFTVTNQTKDGKTDIQLAVPLKQVEATGKTVNIEDAKVRQQLNKAKEMDAKETVTDSVKANPIDTTSLAGKKAVMYEDIDSVDDHNNQTTITSHPTKGDNEGKEAQSVQINKGEISTVALVDMKGLSKGEQDDSKADTTAHESQTSSSTDKSSTNKSSSSTSQSSTKKSGDVKKAEDTKKSDNDATKANFLSAEEIQKMYGGRKITNPTGFKRVADVMQYHNFTVGKPVNVSALAVDTQTGKPIIVKDKDGKDCYLQGRLTFTPKHKDGRVVVPLQQVRVSDTKATFSKDTMATDIVNANHLPFGEAPTNTTNAQKMSALVQRTVPAKNSKDGATGVVIGQDGKRQVFDAETGKAMDRVVEKDGTVNSGYVADVALPSNPVATAKPTTDKASTDKATSTADETSTDKTSDKVSTDKKTTADKTATSSTADKATSTSKSTSTDKVSTDNDATSDNTSVDNATSGTVDMTQLRGKTITILESVTGVDERDHADYTIAHEANKDNKDQQWRVTNPRIQTEQHVNGQKSILRGEKAHLDDTVKFEDLAPNEAVRLKALEINKDNSKAFQTKDGDYLIGVKTFTPTTANGEEVVRFNKSKDADKDFLNAKLDKNGLAKPVGVGTDAKAQTVPSDKKAKVDTAKEDKSDVTLDFSKSLKEIQSIETKYKDAKAGSVDHVILNDAQMVERTIKDVQKGNKVDVNKDIETINHAMNPSGDTNKPNKDQKADMEKLVAILKDVQEPAKTSSSTTTDKSTTDKTSTDKTSDKVSTDKKTTSSTVDKSADDKSTSGKTTEVDNQKDTNGEDIDSKDFPKNGLSAAERLEDVKDGTPIAEHNLDGKDNAQSIAVTEKGKPSSQEQHQSQSQSQNQSQNQNGAGGTQAGGTAPLAKTGAEGEVSHNWFYRLMDRIFHYGK